MAGWTGKAASVVLVFLATWGGAIMYWRGSGAVPSGMDMLLYLGLLPAGVSSAGFAVNGLVRQGVGKALDMTSANPAEAAPATSTGAAHAEAPGSIAVLAGEINLGVGMDAATLLATSVAPPRPVLSSRFRDAQNLPIRVSAADGLDEFDVLGERENGIDTTARERRALALLAPVLDELSSRVASLLPQVAASEEVVVAGLRRSDERRLDCVLTVELLLEPGWSDALLHWVRDWLTHRLVETGIDTRRFEVNINLVSDGVDVWRHVQQLAGTLSNTTERWHLLLACGSSIDLDVIQSWLANGQLATSRNPGGRVPGEGAAGVLFASPDLAQQDGAKLWKPRALDDGGTSSARAGERRRQLVGAAEQWKQSLEPEATAIQFVIHDAAPGDDSVVDAALLTAALNPDLDFGAGSLALVASAGELGSVLPVVQLALAFEQVRRSTEPALVLAGSGSLSRLLALMSASSSHQAADLPSVT
ncbi:hypothetical protein [Stenotrophomonas sp. SY1]|uniref:hypothetical protein n=1 Tax=Stenotrophomonas sp. SY1 TaxID=477235 RepID=UPI001E4F63B6|nr:hypothetical protein [Stenotrophomonas sp. SY1]MCD9087058.1 hypothetical protein [Stenotrophomonas sp. SY1]